MLNLNEESLLPEITELANHVLIIHEYLQASQRGRVTLEYAIQGMVVGLATENALLRGRLIGLLATLPPPTIVVGVDVEPAP